MMIRYCAEKQEANMIKKVILMIVSSIQIKSLRKKLAFSSFNGHIILYPGDVFLSPETMNINHFLNIPWITEIQFHLCDRLIHAQSYNVRKCFIQRSICLKELYVCLSAGTAADTYETPPTSPYSVVSTWSPKTQLVSISNCTNTGTPETSQDALSPPLASTVQNEPMLDCKTGPAKEAEEGPNMTHGLEKVSYVSGLCLNGNTEVDAKLLQECLNTLQLNNIEESTHILNGERKCCGVPTYSFIKSSTRQIFAQTAHILNVFRERCRDNCFHSLFIIAI